MHQTASKRPFLPYLFRQDGKDRAVGDNRQSQICENLSGAARQHPYPLCPFGTFLPLEGEPLHKGALVGLCGEAGVAVSLQAGRKEGLRVHFPADERQLLFPRQLLDERLEPCGGRVILRLPESRERLRRVGAGVFGAGRAAGRACCRRRFSMSAAMPV